MGYITFKATYSNLKLLTAFKETATRAGSVMEMYSTGISIYMDLACFSGDTCLKLKEDAESTMTCRLWVYYSTLEKNGKSKIENDASLIQLQKLAYVNMIPIPKTGECNK